MHFCVGNWEAMILSFWDEEEEKEREESFHVAILCQVLVDEEMKK